MDDNMIDKLYQDFLISMAKEPRVTSITGVSSSYTFTQNTEFTINFNDPGVSFSNMNLFSTTSGAPRLISKRVTRTSATFVCSETGSWENFYLYEPQNGILSSYFRLTIQSSSGGGGSGGGTDNSPTISAVRDMSVKTSQSFTINYTASDDKGITKHEFSDNNGSSYTTIYPSSSGNSYSYSKSYSSEGVRYCKIRITDSGGNTTVSNTFSINVTSSDGGGTTDNPPTISAIGNISSNTYQNFTIYYSANDDSGITKHEFSDNNGSSYSIIYPAGSGGSYSYTKSYSSEGTRYCKIRVTDTAGKVTTSNTFTVSITSSSSGGGGETTPPVTGVKAELYNAKIAFDSSHMNLKNTINSIIADGKFDDVNEKSRLDSAFSSYRDALSHYSKIHQKALDNIALNSKNEAENNSKEHTDSKFSVLSDRIEAKVSAGDIGTLIQQNAYAVKIAWNNLSNYVQFESGGLAIYNGSVSQSQKRAFFDEKGSHFWRDGYYLGKIGTNQYTQDTSKKSIAFNMESQCSYMTWSSKTYSTDTSYTMRWTYCTNAIGDYAAGKLHAGCDIDMHNHYIRNINFEGGGINGTLIFTQIVGMNSNGTATRWYNNSKLVFQNGILIDGTWGKV